MSFLDSVLSSLSGNAPQTPLSQPPAIPASAPSVKKDDRPVGTAPPAPQAVGSTSAGIKRKAEDQLPRPSRPENQPASKVPSTRPAAYPVAPKVVPKIASSKPVLSKPVQRIGTTSTSTAPSARPAPTKPTVAKLAATKPTVSKPAPANASAPKPAAVKAAPVSSKPPPKGSFAALMQQAKAIQEKAPAQVGLLRHQKIQKEKLSKVERKRRLAEAKAQEKAARLGKRPAPGLAVAGKATVKRPTPEPLSYKGTAKPSRTPEPPAYRGTAGRKSHIGTAERRPSKRRMDEYLATDEEDEGEYGPHDDYDDGFSDASSDMEAGFDDVREEEDAALRYARKEDEEELRREMAAKQAKLERQKKLAALASRTKR